MIRFNSRKSLFVSPASGRHPTRPFFSSLSGKNITFTWHFLKLIEIQYSVYLQRYTVLQLDLILYDEYIMNTYDE